MSAQILIDLFLFYALSLVDPLTPCRHLRPGAVPAFDIRLVYCACAGSYALLNIQPCETAHVEKHTREDSRRPCLSEELMKRQFLATGTQSYPVIRDEQGVVHRMCRYQQSIKLTCHYTTGLLHTDEPLTKESTDRLNLRYAVFFRANPQQLGQCRKLGTQACTPLTEPLAESLSL